MRLCMKRSKSGKSGENFPIYSALETQPLPKIAVIMHWLKISDICGLHACNYLCSDPMAHQVVQLSHGRETHFTCLEYNSFGLWNFGQMAFYPDSKKISFLRISVVLSSFCSRHSSWIPLKSNPEVNHKRSYNWFLLLWELTHPKHL